MADPDYMMAQFLECTVHDFEVVLPPEHTHWQNAAGNRVPIVRMSRPHLLNTLRFCERKNRPNGPGTIFWALRREAERRGYRPTEEEWTEARRRADRAGVPDTAGYWEIWVGYGFFSRDGNPVREAEEAEDAELSYSIRYREWEAIMGHMFDVDSKPGEHGLGLELVEMLNARDIAAAKVYKVKS